MARRSINLNSKVARVWEWVFPTVLIALAPVLAQFFLSAFNRGFSAYSVYNLIGYISPRGELLIVSVALVAEAMSELLRRQISRWQRNSIISLCLGFVIFATYLFSGVSGGYSDPVAVSSTSVDIFLWGLALCIICKVAGRS